MGTIRMYYRGMVLFVETLSNEIWATNVKVRARYPEVLQFQR